MKVSITITDKDVQAALKDNDHPFTYCLRKAYPESCEKTRATWWCGPQSMPELIQFWVGDRMFIATITFRGKLKWERLLGQISDLKKQPLTLDFRT